MYVVSDNLGMMNIDWKMSGWWGDDSTKDFLGGIFYGYFCGSSRMELGGKRRKNGQ